MAGIRDNSSPTNSELKEFLCDPLDQMLVPVKTRDGTQKVSPALSIGFMETRNYVNYKLLPCLVAGNKDSNETEIQEWLERMSYIEADLSWVLRLPYQRFWCQVIYDSNLHMSLQSYLSRAPRNYSLNASCREDVLQQQKKIHKFIFLIFLRMSTYKESKMHHITSHVFGQLIYDSFIFDIPRVMDICALYGFDNPQIISKMIHNLFNVQPSYISDLEECKENLLEVFESIEELLGLTESTMSQKQPQVLGAPSQSVIHSLLLSRLLYAVDFVTDISATLFLFVEAFLPASLIFHKFGFLSKIPSFYNSVFPMVEKELRRREKSENASMEFVMPKLVLAKSFLLKLFRNILTASCIDPVLNAKFQENNKTDDALFYHLEEFLSVFSGLSIHTIFLDDYNQNFPFSDDLEVFAEAGVDIDTTCLEYIVSSVESAARSNSYRSNPVSSNRLPTNNPTPDYSDVELSASANGPITNGDVDIGVQGATAGTPDEIRIVSLIQGVLDVLPEFGDGFIEKCLEFYNFDAERVVDSLITQELPITLRSLPTDLKRKQVSLGNNEVEEKPSILSQRKNIFDDDEFDVFGKQEVARDKIHMGKSGKTPKNYSELSSDKESSFLKELTLTYEQTIEDEESNLYNDEYDDTYDSQPVCLAEQQPENELLKIRPFTTPNILKSVNASKEGAEEENEEEVEEEEEEEEDSILRDSYINIAERKTDFCINPEILREKAEAHRQAKYANKHPNQQVASEKPRDWKNKERHKGQNANHNRRSQSDFKKSRGMGAFPPR